MDSVKPAATIILIRDQAGLDGIEVYMTKRPKSMVFLPDYYVFPGGVMHQEDKDEQLVKRCVKQFTEVDTAFAVTAMRECFEEVGYLLAGDELGWLGEAEFNAIRERMNNKRFSFRDWVIEHNLPIRTDLMRYYGHRITPRNGLPRRFDTRYFLAAVSREEQLRPCSREVAEAYWLDPAEALQQAKAGNYKMVIPTIDALADLARFRTVDEAVRLAAGVGVPRPYELA